MTRGTIANNVITDHPGGPGIKVQGAQNGAAGAPTGSLGIPGSSTDKVLISGNKIAGDATNKLNPVGIQAGIEGRAGQANFEIISNGTLAEPIRNTGSHGISVGNGGNTTAHYKIDGNYVSPNNTGAGIGALGIWAGTDKSALSGGGTASNTNMRLTVTNNHIRNTDASGIRILNGDTNGRADVRVSNNDVANGGSGRAPIRVENGGAGEAGYNPTMCATISSNTTQANAPAPAGTVPGILIVKLSDPVGSHPFGFTGLAPSPATFTQVESFLTGLNPAANQGTSGYGSTRAFVAQGDNFTNCTHPAGF
jgi:hypothetical protein